MLNSNRVRLLLIWSGLWRVGAFGHGNPEPYFLGKKWTLEKERLAKAATPIIRSKNTIIFKGISFNGKIGCREPPFRDIDLVFNVSFDRWRGIMLYNWKYYISPIAMYIKGRAFRLLISEITQKYPISTAF